MNSPSTPNSWIGHTVGDNNRYRLDKLLGGGGMGDVFLAMDTRMNDQVALKILKDTLGASNEMRRRFEREIEICVALKSENIVRVTDKGFTSEGYPFYVMEYLKGQSLRQVLLREKRLSPERSINIMMQVCNGLQHAHKGVYIQRQGATERIQVIHRDLKPDNIFLENIDSREVVKIVDFGIAKIRSESFEQTSFTKVFLGTFRYASPEQLKGVINIDQRADIYSLGIILYEMLSGADPFGFNINARNPSEASWIFAHTSEPPKPLRAQPGCEDLPAELEEAVMRCLEKEPEKRFESVEELNTALRSVLVLIQASIDPRTNSRPQSPLNGSYEVTEVRPIIQGQKVQPKVTEVQRPQPQPLPEVTEVQRPQPQPLPEVTEVQRPQPQPLPEVTEIQHPQPQPLPEVTEVQRPKNSSLKVAASIVIFFTACITSFFAYPWVISRQTLDRIKAVQGNYEECIALSEKVSSDSGIYLEVQEILNKCRQNYAIKLAKENKCAEAYQVNEKIPKNLFAQVQAQIDNICVIPEAPESSGNLLHQQNSQF